MEELKTDVKLSFKLLEFSIRTMLYAEQEKFDKSIFGQELTLLLKKENVGFSSNEFQKSEEIIKASQMAVGAAFGATAICLDCLLEKHQSNDTNLEIAKPLATAVRNAFSHGIAAPTWYVKPHKFLSVDLSFVSGPTIDLAAVNGQPFDYEQIGGLAVWLRLKDYVLTNT